jgi:hypothetical protein
MSDTTAPSAFWLSADLKSTAGFVIRSTSNSG